MGASGPTKYTGKAITWIIQVLSSSFSLLSKLSDFVSSESQLHWSWNKRIYLPEVYKAHLLLDLDIRGKIGMICQPEKMCQGFSIIWTYPACTMEVGKPWKYNSVQLCFIVKTVIAEWTLLSPYLHEWGNWSWEVTRFAGSHSPEPRFKPRIPKLVLFIVPNVPGTWF